MSVVRMVTVVSEVSIMSLSGLSGVMCVCSKYSECSVWSVCISAYLGALLGCVAPALCCSCPAGRAGRQAREER